MSEAILCMLCGKRRAKRGCPAVHGSICALCCGEQRENVLFCPLSCSYLQEAHKREKTLEIPVEEIANADIEVTEDFIREREEAMAYCILAVLEAALNTQGAVDEDVLEALAAIIQTERTALSGLVYETRAENTVARSLQQKIKDAIRDYKNAQTEGQFGSPVAERDLFRILVFLHRVGQQNQNGRPKGRLFIGLLQTMAPPVEEAPDNAPRIIL